MSTVEINRENGEFVAVHQETGKAGSGETETSALLALFVLLSDDLEKDLAEAATKSKRAEEIAEAAGITLEEGDRARIVETPGVLGGQPRLDGYRISVRQIADMVDGESSVPEVAEELDLSIEEVETALAYHENHPEKMRALREEREETIDRIRANSRAN